MAESKPPPLARLANRWKNLQCVGLDMLKHGFAGSRQVAHRRLVRRENFTGSQSPPSGDAFEFYLSQMFATTMLLE